MTVALKKNVPGFRDANGVFRPIRSASYVGGGSSRRKATAKDRKKYSRAKAGDLGKTRQERALEAPWDREYRLEQEAKAAQKREQDRIEKQIAAEVYGETSGRTSRGKGKTLAQFIRSEGGINTKSKVRKGRVRYGDSLENFTRKGSGSTGLVTTTPGKGKSLDYMHQAAREAGYDVASMDDLLDALDNELRSGKKTYSTHGAMAYNPAKDTRHGYEIYHGKRRLSTVLGSDRKAALKIAKSFGDGVTIKRVDLTKQWQQQMRGRINPIHPELGFRMDGKDKRDLLRDSKGHVLYVQLGEKSQKPYYCKTCRRYFLRSDAKENPAGLVCDAKGCEVRAGYRIGKDDYCKKHATERVGVKYVEEFKVRKNPAGVVPKGFNVKRGPYAGQWYVRRDGTNKILGMGSTRKEAIADARQMLAKRKTRERKKNPDLLGMFANAAVGIASTLQINEMMKSRKRTAAPKKRGTTKAKRRNPLAGKRSTARKNPRSAIRNPRSGQPNLFKRQPKGELYVLTIGSGDDLISVYLHDGDKDGFSKRFKTMAAAKTFATRNKVKMVENPKQNGIIKRAWARSRAASEYRRELRLEAAADRARKRRQKAEAKAKANPPAKRGKTAVARAANGKKAVARSAKANPKIVKLPVGFKMVKRANAFNGGDFYELQDPQGLIVGWGTTKTNALRTFKQYGTRARAGQGFSKSRAKTIRESARSLKLTVRNPRSTARRRTFEMFQGRKVTTARPMMVSNHAPANLDALGDLVELKIAGGPTLKFNGKGTKLCAAGGKLWIAGKRFAKANPAAKANELNPIGEIDHVVYGTYKPHHGDHDYTHYIHKLGEESGKRPILCVDREGFPVIRGGNYKIEARGIVD